MKNAVPEDIFHKTSVSEDIFQKTSDSFKIMMASTGWVT